MFFDWKNPPAYYTITWLLLYGLFLKKIDAINGSPRKNGNTAQLLQKALDGAASAGAEIRKTQFPADLAKAFETGKTIAC